MSSLEEIINELEKQTKIPRNELKERIVKKQEELSGLVSLEGAAYLVARELGVDLLTEARRKLKIKNIVSGMRNVSVIGRIFKISNIVEFKRLDGSQGKVVNIYLGDETGFVKVPLWDDQVKLVEDGSIKLGEAIQITNGLTKENIFGDIEISLGRYGSIRQIADESLPSIEELAKHFMVKPERALIKNIVPGSFEVLASIVHVFKSNFLFKVCPVCGIAIEQSKCSEHGDVEPNPALVVSCIIDDGSGDMRAVFFRETAERLLGVEANEIATLDQEKRYELIAEKLMGRELILQGRVRKNKIFDRLELMVNEFKDIDALEESKKLIDEIELKLS